METATTPEFLPEIIEGIRVLIDRCISDDRQHALGLERGRRALLAEALILCLDTLPLLRERLLNTHKHGLEPVA